MLQFVRDHLTIVLSATGAIYLAIRLFSVSGGSAETYSIILQTQGTGTVVFSAILGIVPSIPIYLVAGWVLWRTFTVGRLTRTDILPVVGFLVVSLFITPLVVVVIPVMFAVIVGLLLLLVIIARRLAEWVVGAIKGSLRDSGDADFLNPGDSGLGELSRARPRGGDLEVGAKVLGDVRGEMDKLVTMFESKAVDQVREISPRVSVLQERLKDVDDPDLRRLRVSQEIRLKRLRRSAALALVLPQVRSFMLRVSLPVWLISMIFLLAIVDGPWLPLERVESPDESIVGYVLESGNDGVIMLRDEPRRVFRIEEVVDRTYCSSSDWTLPGGMHDVALRPLLLPNASAGYPPCE